MNTLSQIRVVTRNPFLLACYDAESLADVGQALVSACCHDLDETLQLLVYATTGIQKQRERHHPGRQ